MILKLCLTSHYYLSEVPRECDTLLKIVCYWFISSFFSFQDVIFNIKFMKGVFIDLKPQQTNNFCGYDVRNLHFFYISISSSLSLYIFSSLFPYNKMI